MNAVFHTIEKKLERPEDNDSIFRILAKAEIISEKFARKAFGMGRFRNILVLGYMMIDEKRVYENLQKLDLFEDFAGYIGKYIKKADK